MLQEKLQTKVSIDSIRIGFFSDDVRLYNLQVEDLQHRPMLKLERFAVEIDMLALLNSEVQIEEISVKGLHAKLYQERRDTAANYQFVIDAFKKDKKAPEKKPKEEQEKKKKSHLDLKRAVVEDVDLMFNEQHAAIGKLRIKKDRHERLSGTIQQVAGSWVHHKKRLPCMSITTCSSMPSPLRRQPTARASSLSTAYTGRPITTCRISVLRNPSAGGLTTDT